MQDAFARLPDPDGSGSIARSVHGSLSQFLGVDANIDAVTHWSAEALLGMPAAQTVLPDDRGVMLQAYEEGLAARQAIRMRYRGVRPDHSSQWLEITGAAVEDDGQLRLAMKVRKAEAPYDGRASFRLEDA